VIVVSATAWGIPVAAAGPVVEPAAAVGGVGYDTGVGMEQDAIGAVAAAAYSRIEPGAAPVKVGVVVEVVGGLDYANCSR
jgi:hypothetical protein